jgi:hypothetical protein
LSELLECLRSMPRLLNNIDLRAALTNGKVEVPLKTFLGITWVGTGAQRTYLMDKRFGGNARLDLVAFEQNQAKFWVEAKCDFAADRQAVERSAQSAIDQVQSYAAALPAELKPCPYYIVHFLCELPNTNDYPEWVTAFNPLRGKTPYTSREVGDYYRGRITGLGLNWGVCEMVVRFTPEIQAVVAEACLPSARTTARGRQFSDGDVSAPYSIDEHRHRFACWAASRAASVKGCRFSVEHGRAILDVVMRSVASDPKNLPELSNFDGEHAQWRTIVISEAKTLCLPFTHGIAAKLINVYLKAMFVCGGHDNHERVSGLHPPIDAVLLKELEEKKFGGPELAHYWGQARKIRWSKLDSGQYQAVIQNLRRANGSDVNLWKIEEYWRGYQSN